MVVTEMKKVKERKAQTGDKLESIQRPVIC